MTKKIIIDYEAKILVDSIFLEINLFNFVESTAIQVNRVFEKYPFLLIYKPNVLKFPKLDFELNQKDINSLIGDNLIDQFNNIKLDKKNTYKLSALEKLLYSILWKQGDLGKERHIISGIINKSDPGQGVVFHYFGRHLAKKNENPIVDQHVIRAFRLKECNLNDHNEMNLIRNSDFSLSKKDCSKKIKLIQEYLIWHKNIRLKFNEAEHENFVYNIDLLLFSLGKYIKNNK